MDEEEADKDCVSQSPHEGSYHDQSQSYEEGNNDDDHDGVGGDVGGGPGSCVFDALAKLKLFLNKLILNQVDEFEVHFLAQQLSVDISDQVSFSQKKYTVQKSILQQIVKSDRSDMFVKLLDETEKNLGRKKPLKYLCCLVGCLFQADKHKSYLAHLKRVHSTHNQLRCNFGYKCSREFSTMDLLLGHVKDCHSNLQTVRPEPTIRVYQVACRCDMISCRGANFPDINKFMAHYTKFHNKEARECIFQNCDNKFPPDKPSTVRHHFSLKHKKIGKLKLKAKHILKSPEDALGATNDNSEGEVDDESILTEFEEDPDLYTAEALETIGDIEEDCDLNEDEENINFYMMQYADFYNRMMHFNHVPSRTVQEISREYLENSLKSKAMKERKLRESLKEVSSMTVEMVNHIVEEVIEDDDFIKAQQTLDTEYKRKTFIKENFKFIEPQEIILNAEGVKKGEAKDVIHYIPVTESFKHLLEDKTFNEVLDREREVAEKNDEILKDLTDGTAFKENKYFKENPGAYAGHFYSDSVELANPLGAARGKHKISQVFYTLGQIPREQRSRIDRIQLCMVFKDKLVKKYGYNVLFQPLISDLRKLEDGIVIRYPIERQVKMGLLAYSADNLEAHSLGGFSTCFSSSDICRFCHATYKDLETHIHDFDGEESHRYWTPAEYDRVCSDILSEESEESETYCPVSSENLFTAAVSDDDSNEESDNEEDVPAVNNSDDSEFDEGGDSTSELRSYGLRRRCPLNVLKSFHCVLGFPPDVMHDLLEGVVAQDLFGILKICVELEMFSFEAYNAQLSGIDLGKSESADKPQIVPSKGKKLPGKALSLLVHLRNFPLIIKKFVDDYEKEVLQFALKLVDITHRLMATEFRRYEIVILEDKIIEYLDARKCLFDNFPHLLGSPKPKGSNQ